MRYHVFIEGSHDPSPGARERLASTLAQRYGLPPTVIAQRLAEGRFCAWASIDLPTARRLGGELESIGARYTITEEGAGPVATTQLAPAARSTVLSYAAPPPVSPGARVSESGLAAARPPGSDINLDLGALRGGGDGENWRLSQLDGTEEERTMESPHMVAAVAAAERAVASAPPAPRRARPSKPSAPPVDPFAPPDAARESALELEDKPAYAGTVAAPPAPATMAAGAPSLGGTRSAAAVAGSSSLYKGPLLERMRDTMANDPRARFLAGVLLAFLVGLIPAQLFAMWRTDVARDEVSSALQGEYRQASTPELWATLETAREDASALMSSRQRRVAVSAALLWVATGAGVAFLWFRVIDWDGAMPRLAQAPASAAAARRRATR
ncbi:MAG TPA: hypothetical protein VMZ28_07245 [Kofleriaceae bacterium]|nr:hypothetical protein [Kofleriaceae bacterium]